jgi:hypothetical protein
MAPRRRNLGRIPVAAFLTLLALGSLAATARAGCVHDALRRTQESTGSAHFRWLIRSGAMQAPADESDAATRPIEGDVPQGPRPCDGPSCSRSDGLPTAPTPLVAPAVGSWAWAGPGPILSGSGSESLARKGARVRSVSRGVSTFHPPRAGSAH